MAGPLRPRWVMRRLSGKDGAGLENVGAVVAGAGITPGSFASLRMTARFSGMTACEDAESGAREAMTSEETPARSQ